MVNFTPYISKFFTFLSDATGLSKPESYKTEADYLIDYFSDKDGLTHSEIKIDMKFKGYDYNYNQRQALVWVLNGTKNGSINLNNWGEVSDDDVKLLEKENFSTETILRLKNDAETKRLKWLTRQIGPLNTLTLVEKSDIILKNVDGQRHKNLTGFIKFCILNVRGFSKEDEEVLIKLYTAFYRADKEKAVDSMIDKMTPSVAETSPTSYQRIEMMSRVFLAVVGSVDDENEIYSAIEQLRSKDEKTKIKGLLTLLSVDLSSWENRKHENYFKQKEISEKIANSVNRIHYSSDNKLLDTSNNLLNTLSYRVILKHYPQLGFDNHLINLTLVRGLGHENPDIKRECFDIVDEFDPYLMKKLLFESTDAPTFIYQGTLDSNGDVRESANRIVITLKKAGAYIVHNKLRWDDL